MTTAEICRANREQYARDALADAEEYRAAARAAVDAGDVRAAWEYLDAASYCRRAARLAQLLALVPPPPRKEG